MGGFLEVNAYGGDVITLGAAEEIKERHVLFYVRISRSRSLLPLPPQLYSYVVKV